MAITHSAVATRFRNLGGCGASSINALTFTTDFGVLVDGEGRATCSRLKHFLVVMALVAVSLLIAGLCLNVSPKHVNNNTNALRHNIFFDMTALT